jgi:hypothetical protein
VLDDDALQQRVGKLISGFGYYVREFDRRTPLTGEKLAAHRACIDRRRQAADVQAAVQDQQFVLSLRRVLNAWSIGRRASVLAADEQFLLALQAAAPELAELESLTIDAAESPDGLAKQLWLVIDSLGVVENHAKIVAGTKTLHHLLPELVMPMDRSYTGRFFGMGGHEWQNSVYQRRAFCAMYRHFQLIAHRVLPQEYVTGTGWRTGRAKLLDNAIIGFCLVELKQAGGASTAGQEIAFNVDGYPPAKNEARSMFSDQHGHAPRIRLLLEAARDALADQEFTPVTAGPIALDVVVRATADQPAWDATNYLGGIADVLEDKAHRSAIDHLGDLAQVRLYQNDRQIKEVSYREVASSQAGYSVTVRHCP